MTPRRLWNIAGLLFAIPAVVAACFLPFLRWVPQASFDILGFAWVLTNAPNLFLWVLVLTFGIAALYCGFRGLLADLA